MFELGRLKHENVEKYLVFQWFAVGPKAPTKVRIWCREDARRVQGGGKRSQENEHKDEECSFTHGIASIMHTCSSFVGPSMKMLENI